MKVAVDDKTQPHTLVEGRFANCIFSFDAGSLSHLQCSTWKERLPLGMDGLLIVLKPEVDTRPPRGPAGLQQRAACKL